MSKVFIVGMPPVSGSPRIGQAHTMGIGIGIFVVALGAVLTFAVDWSIGGMDLKNVGWILMIAGVVGLILFSALWRRRLAAETVTSVRPRRLANVPRIHDDPLTPTPQATTVALEPVTPMTPRTTTPSRATTVRASAPVAPVTASPSQGRPQDS